MDTQAEARLDAEVLDDREERLAGSDDEKEEQPANIMDLASDLGSGSTHHPEADDVEGDTRRSESEAP